MKILRTKVVPWWSVKRLLHDFVVSSDTVGAGKKEILQYLSIMEDTFLAIDVACWKKQWTLEDLFKWNVELSLCRDKWGRWSLNDIHDLLLLNFKVLPHQFDTIGHGAQFTTFRTGNAWFKNLTICWPWIPRPQADTLLYKTKTQT